MKTPKRWFGIVGLVAVVASGACGGGGSTPAPLTKAAFIERADRLCAEANEKLDALGEPQNVEELRSALSTGATTTRELLADLRALGTPGEDRATLQQIYSLVEQGLAKFEAAIAAITSGDVAKVTTLAEEGQGLFEQANAASGGYGFKDCAE